MHRPWFLVVVGSFLGNFRLMDAPMSDLFNAVYGAVLMGGLILLVLQTIRNRRAKEGSTPCMLPPVLRILLPLICAGSVLLLMIYAYYSDYQAQGRYLMPSLLPIMIIVTEGYREAFSANERKGRIAAAVLAVSWILMFAAACLLYMVPACLGGGIPAPA